MANVQGSNQTPLITQRYLNTSTYAGDPTPGAVVSTANVSGSIIQTYGGFVGGILTMDKAAANYYSDPVNGQQLYPGQYQYVQFDSLGALNAVQGQVVFWKTNVPSPVGTNLLPAGGFIVTCVESAQETGFIAGIALANTVPGNYWWIQIAGIAQVKYASSQGPATPLVGDLVFADYNTPSNLAYDPTQSGNPTFAQLKAVLGTAWATTLPSAIGPVMLTFNHIIPGGGGGEG